MKLKYLPIVTLGILTITNVWSIEIYNKDGNKLDFYGKLNEVHYMSDNINKYGNHSSVYYGLRGETRISNDLIGFSVLEHKLNFDRYENEENKIPLVHLGFIGIRISDTETIDYGRNYGVLHDISYWTNIIPEFGGSTNIIDNFLSDIANGVVTYRNTNFFGIIDGLNFSLQYQNKKDGEFNKKGRGLREANGDGYGLSVVYNLGNGVSAGAVITSSNLTSSQMSIIKNNQGKKANAYSFGLKYDFDNLYLAGLYKETYNMTPYGDFNKNDEHYGFSDRVRNIELTAQYQFDFGLKPSISYLQSRIDENNRKREYDAKKYIAVGASYKFNNNMLTFIDYKINLLSKSQTVSSDKNPVDSIVALGITYIF